MPILDNELRQCLLQEERNKYNHLWSDVPAYRRSSPELQIIQSTWGTYMDDIKTVLDVGAGPGQGVRYLEQMGKKVTATDIADDLVEEYKHKPGQLVICAADNMPFGDNTFDLVVCCDVLEHLSPFLLLQSLKEICRVGRLHFLLSACLIPASFGPNLHQTLMPPDTWRSEFSKYIYIEQDMLSLHHLIVRGKKRAEVSRALHDDS